jgi:polar amino acid transport system substrate-binding protein
MLFAIAGCGGGEEPSVLEPKITPPLIASEGVLRAGVDLSYPPFAGKDNGQQVGIDIDVAAALAERLGLTLEIIDVKTTDIPAALKGKQIDVALAAMPITDAVLAGVTPAGSYITDGSAFFSAVASGTDVPEVSAANVGGMKVGCQKESATFWKLESDYGVGFAESFDSLRDAFDALEAGDIDVVAADAVVGAYISRDYAEVRFTGNYGSPTALGVTVAPDSADLEAAVREALDGLSSDGILETIRTKWVGGLMSLEASASAETSVAP